MGAAIIYEVEIMGIRDQFNKMVGKTRYVVSRIFLQLNGTEVTPVLGLLNQAGRQMIEAEGISPSLGNAYMLQSPSSCSFITYYVYFRSSRTA
jgi:hypothetical protein